jgi:leucyl-tRNA synthetase
MEYQFRAIEKKWQTIWKEKKAYQVSNESSKPKCYVLDMFPYPSGAGLHVGHPLGYIASDIYSRFKRLKGFNVLHPMGYDAFGLPAEQYAIEHGVHPAKSTHDNIDNFRKQLDNIGFCFDWEREVKTCDAQYYKWTQWIFLQLFNSYFDKNEAKAKPISLLLKDFDLDGNANHICPGDITLQFTATAWKGFTEKEQQAILMQYRLAFCGYGEVNWCAALGTVLANDEVVNGLSERGGHPVEKKRLRQWYLRITEYADRLLTGLDTIQFSDAMKEMQSNWIGKSFGAEIDFNMHQNEGALKVYTTRPDTIFGVDFMVVAPEHAMIEHITPTSHKAAVEEYIAYVKSRSERERMAEKKITGCFTGAYVENPFSKKLIPVWISEYVLAGYGTGAIMAVPCGDERDFKFAQHFNIPITNIIGDAFKGIDANPTKDAKLTNSDFLNGVVQKDAIAIVNEKMEALGIGKRKINYKMRDAAFSRQRYWGEPFPIKWVDGIAYPMLENELPLLLPEVDNYSPGPEGEGPLANIASWKADNYETNTMPGYAGSSWYFIRYMDPSNEKEFCNRKVSDYWGQVDLYIGGTEHAVGHLLYSRMWTKALYDLGHIGFDEPFKKLLNQGMIQGSSRFVYRIRGTQKYVSAGLAAAHEVDALHVDVNMVDGVELNIAAFKKWKPDFSKAEFILEDGKYICGVEVEKMSKSKFNTVNPDDLVERYGADTFRMYEMFLGPVEQSKPWDTKGIEGVHRFLKKCWRLFFDELKGKVWNEDAATDAELKIVHKAIKKIEEDTERHSFNTAVSTFMICVNELADANCHKKEILSQLLILMTPYAPHFAEELWQALGNHGLVVDASYPVFEAKYVTESAKDYPVSINGKMRVNIAIDLAATETQVHEMVLANEIVKKWVADTPIKKIIFVKGKMINIVI